MLPLQQLLRGLGGAGGAAAAAEGARSFASRALLLQQRWGRARACLCVLLLMLPLLLLPALNQQRRVAD